VALAHGYIDAAQVEALGRAMGASDYGRYLVEIARAHRD
jgi:hypothetical protein